MQTAAIDFFIAIFLYAGIIRIRFKGYDLSLAHIRQGAPLNM